jgi:hypothetical protein
MLTIGSTTRYATYVSGSGSASLLFRYTVQAGDLDSDGIAVASPIDLNGGTIKDVPGNDAVLTFTPPDTSSVLVDGVAPTITSVTGPAAGTYIVGQNLDFTVQFSDTVAVTGTPRLVLTIGSTTRYATYLSGTGTSTLTFRYTVQSGDLDSDGIAVASPIDLNGGTITDVPGNDAVLSFTPPLPVACWWTVWLRRLPALRGRLPAPTSSGRTSISPCSSARWWQLPARRGWC